MFEIRQLPAITYTPEEIIRCIIQRCEVTREQATELVQYVNMVSAYTTTLKAGFHETLLPIPGGGNRNETGMFE